MKRTILIMVSRLLYFFCISLSLCTSAIGAQSWNFSSGDLSDWAFVVNYNQNSRVIGSFTERIGLGIGDNGLYAEAQGYLKYSLTGGEKLANYAGGSISLTYQDDGSEFINGTIPSRYTSQLPNALLLEGSLSNGDRVVLSCDLSLSVGGSRTTVDIDFVSSSFKVVNTLYYQDSMMPMDPPDFFFSTGASLSDADFGYFLSTVDSIMIRNFNTASDFGGIGTSGINITYVSSIELKQAVVPEPSIALMGMFGLGAMLFVRRNGCIS